jgi:NAD(P)-dependent dehydrogenase (short-subunit alcohol dehydrogenase family)
MEQEELKQEPQRQKQELPGSEQEMTPKPITDDPSRQGCGKLTGKTAIITGGDSGIGKAVAILFAKEGADVAIVYLSETEDANETKELVEKYKRKCLLVEGDLSKEHFCKEAIQRTIDEFGKLDIVVNNAAMQIPADTLEELQTENLIKTFETNIFSMFWITKYALPYLKQGASIINSSSITAYKGSPQLLDYSATKGAIVTFTRSLSQNLMEKGIRVNGVAPGPIWTPLIPASFDEERTAQHGQNAPMKRVGQPVEVAPSYLFLASDDSTYISGQFLHPNGGEVVNG